MLASRKNLTVVFTQDIQIYNPFLEPRSKGNYKANFSKSHKNFEKL